MFGSKNLLTAAGLALCLLVSACITSSPPSRFYTLSPVAEAPVASIGAAEVMIGPVEMPGYLDRPEIVTRGERSRIERAGFDRWAESLQAQFQQTLTTNVAILLGSDNVVEFPVKRQFGDNLRVVARVQRFDTDRQGNAILEVQWGMLKLENAEVGPPKRSRYEAQAESASDYDDIIAALNRTIADFAEDIAKHLAELSQ
jgi:uncharacterized lipoprotein YmbA